MILFYYNGADGKVNGAAILPYAPPDNAKRLTLIVDGMNAVLDWENCTGHVIDAEDGGLLAYLARHGAKDLTVENFFREEVEPNGEEA